MRMVLIVLFFVLGMVFLEVIDCVGRVFFIGLFFFLFIEFGFCVVGVGFGGSSFCFFLFCCLFVV